MRNACCFLFLCLAMASQGIAADSPASDKPAARPQPPPLSAEQLEKIRALVRTTQTRDAELKAALEGKQRELALAYSLFDLDEARVSALEDEILALQRQLLANYHALHVELRKTVGPERFAVLISRINAVMQSPAERSKEKGTPAAEPEKARGERAK